VVLDHLDLTLGIFEFHDPSYLPPEGHSKQLS
jgi:hypothetical protein